MSQPHIQLLRYSINPAALDNLSAAWIPLPYAGAIERFRQAVESDRNKAVWIPYRQLNNALLACIPTLTHGFETYENGMRRALVVGTAQNPIYPPTPEQLQHLLLLWANSWIQQLANNPTLQAHANVLREALAKPLSNFQWTTIDVKRLVTDVTHQNGLAFSALPSLLATLLHGQTTVIGNNQTLTWRKVQGDGADRTGLYVVSQPFEGKYPVDEKGTLRNGYFAYRLDFRVQTQAGRFNTINKSEPWIFITLSCQRYAHEPVNKFAHKRNVSVLTGVRQARLTEHPSDSTLIRLVLENQSDSKPVFWRDQLHDVLQAFGARKLVDPIDLRTDPARFANLHSQPDWLDDEYLIVHTEGIHYGVNRKRNHALKTGFPFAERRAILDSVLNLLGGLLIANKTLSADTVPTPSGIKTPPMLRSYDFFVDRQKRQDVKQKAAKQLGTLVKDVPSALLPVQEAIRQVLPKNFIRLVIFHQTHQSGRLMAMQLKLLLGVEQDKSFPDWLDVKTVQIPENDLLEPLATPETTTNKVNHWRQEHVRKREAWTTFLAKYLPGKSAPTLAIIELPIVKQKGVSSLQSIKGAVREACARAGINSQMLQLMQVQTIDEVDVLKDESVYRLNTAFLDLLIRHTGTLYGTPSAMYHCAGLPESIANKMDVIALYRHQTQPDYGDIHYALAIRLQATGIVDVLLPGQEDWISYLQAGPILGRLFAEARKESMSNGKRDSKTSSVKLANFRLKNFLTNVLKRPSERPTLFVIDADVWRNGRTDEGKIWPQLQNGLLAKEREVVNINEFEYSRNHPELAHILGIIRLRNGIETPDYLPIRESIEEILPDRDFAHLSGFIDDNVPDLLHYFSVGRLPETQKKVQWDKNTVDLFKLQEYIKGIDPRNNHYGVDTAFKHQQAIEMVPFYVHPDLSHEEGKTALCRAIHWSRISPAWSAGNTLLPYPMHLAKCLLEDQLCIIRSE
ncbi:RNaseH domain-containing protein [Spirosoma litoris]